jgi:predicted transcriptional regulator
VQASGYDTCVVVNDTGIVFGSLGGAALAADATTPAEQVMEPGPATIRPHLLLRDVVHYLQQKDLDRIVVTTAEGRLMGLLYRQDAVQKLGEGTSTKGGAVRRNGPAQPATAR